MQSFFKLPGIKQFCLAAIVLLSLPHTALAGNAWWDTRDWSKEDTVIITNAAGLGVITVWGGVNWDYFQNSPKQSSEGWFSKGSKHGGQDKLGHLYASYVFSHILGGLYDKKGYSRRQSAALGALSALSMTTWMEIGDAFSSYGFSQEDMVMNIIGSTAGYLLYAFPSVSDFLDLRLEYCPDFNESDFVTDYEHQKILLAFKFSGFNFARKSALKYLELQVGYFARGYPDRDDRERNLYAGIGINVPELFKHLNMPKTSTFFNYIQFPFTYLAAEQDLNR